MAQSLPWSVKGIDANTREAAREAARRAGMSVSDWLEHLIREEARRAAQEAGSRGPQPHHGDEEVGSREVTRDLQARLLRLSESGSGKAMDRSRGSAQRPDELEALVNHAALLEQRTRDSEAKTTTALESIVGWIEKAEGRMIAAERAAAERQERATSVIADAIKTVSSRVSDVERRAQPAPERIAERSAERQPAPLTDRPALPQRRPALMRDSLAAAVSDIQSRRRELDEPAPRSAPQPAPSAIMQNLRDDIGRISGLQHPERRMGERRADVTPLMNELRADLSQLRSEIAGIAAAPASSRLEDSIRELARKLDQRPDAAPVNDLARPLARIESELARLQAQDGGGRFNRIESEIQRLGDRIEALAASAQDPRLLAAAVHELGGLRDALTRSNHAPQLDDLSSQISALAGDMARVREQMANARPSGDIESAIDDMRAVLLNETRAANGIGHGLLQRIAHQLESVSAAVGNVPASGLAEPDRAQLSLLSSKLDQLAQRTQPESEALARRIEDLALKLDDLSDRGSAELLDRVDRLSQQIDMLAARGPAAIEKQLDALSVRMEAMTRAQEAAAQRPAAAGPAGVVDLTPIEDMIGDLARRLDDVARPDSGTQGLQSLERQLAALTERLEIGMPDPARSPAAADGLERTLQDLMRSLGGLREETTSAVDRAARAAVADAMMQAPAPASDASAHLSLLRNDLAGLKDVHVSIDKRTHSAIGAVNDTLEKIVQRLAQLEDDIARDRPVDAPLPTFVNQALGGPASPQPIPASRSLVADELPAPEPAPPPPAGWQRPSARELVAQAQRSVRQPQPNSQAQPAEIEPLPEAAPDMPLEPGSGRPRGRSEPGLSAALPDAGPPAAAAPPAGSINPNLIAAARRAAMAASAEAEALKADDRKGAKAKGSRLALPISLKETLEKRRKPILLGLAAIVLAIGAGQVATTLLSDQPRSVVASPSAQRGEASQPPRAEPGQSEAGRAGAAADIEPAPARPDPALPPPDRSSMQGPAASQAAQAAALPASGAALLQAPETTASVRTAPVEMAALAPASAAPEAGRFTAAPGRVSNLGELAPTLGTPGLRKAALEGDPNAVYELAVRATDGVGMARDHKLALRLFERAAAAGSGPAQFRLANMHEKGIGTARDAKLAMTWYRRAADKGNAKAMHNLAVLIAEGADGRPDYAAAAALFRKGAEYGVRDSQYNLAILLGRGLGVEQDLTQSYTWFAVAAAQGDADAARKRDEVGTKLSAVDLAAGRTASLNWKAKTPDPAANEVAAPAEGWDPKPQRPQRPRAS